MPSMPTQASLRHYGRWFGIGAVTASCWQFVKSPSCAWLISGSQAVSAPLMIRVPVFCTAFMGLGLAFDSVYSQVFDDNVMTVCTTMYCLTSTWGHRPTAYVALAGGCMLGATILLDKLDEKEKRNKTKILEPSTTG